MSRLGEWVLRRLSAPVEGGASKNAGRPEWERGEELGKICRHIPWFPSMVRDARILDFGCGGGYQVARMAELGARHVVGIEIQPRLREEAWTIAERYGVADRVRILPELPDDLLGTFDLVLTQNSMEHFSDPASALRSMREGLAPGGRVVTVFGPLWWHPYGAHMHFFTWMPWPQVWFSEQTVMNVRSDYRDDGATRYEDVPGGLNRMTVSKFGELVSEAGFRFDFFRVEAIRDLPLVHRIPGVRELFAKNVYAILEPRSPAHRPRATRAST